MAETMAPAFVTPQRGVQIPPVVSIVGTGRPLSEGIQLHHNRDKYGFFLGKEIEGFGLAPFENTTLPRASGGAVLRHRRTAEGTMFLPLTLVSPNPASMYDMMAWLVETVTGQGGFFDVVFFDPYSQEARRRTVLYDSGLETVNEEIPDFKHIVGITGTFLSPFWRGPERVVTERIAPPVKPLITADPGSPVNRWDDPEFSDTVAYEPWFVVDGGLEKQGTGEDWAGAYTGHTIEVVPGETISVSADLSYVDGPEVGDTVIMVRSLDENDNYISGSATATIRESYSGTYTEPYIVADGGVYVELGFYTMSDVHANTRVRIDNLNVQRDIQYLARYEWEGEPHASPSIKRDHTGQIVARNLSLNPSFEISGSAGFTYGSRAKVGSRTAIPERVKSGQYSTIVSWTSGASEIQTIVQQEVDVQPGQWVAFSSWATDAGASFGRVYVAGILSERGNAGASHLQHHHVGEYESIGTNSMTRVEYVVQATESNVDRMRVGLRFSGTPESYSQPSGYAYLDAWNISVADTEADALAQVESYFDGDTPDVVDEGSREGAFSFPFFPVFLADSTVQGEHELRVEGDGPVWPVWEITGPGRDVEIIGPDGSRLFVEGEVTSPITIVTEPGKRSIRDASGLIWDRMKPGDDQFFALEPGEQTVRMTMVGGNPESTIKAVYSENWKTPRGTAQGMIRGGVV